MRVRVHIWYTYITAQISQASKLMVCTRASEKLRARDEIDILKRFDHQNVIKIIEAFEDDENFIQGNKISYC